jgi:hypothetical protein
MDEIVETLNEVICGEIPVEEIKLPRLRSRKKRAKKKAQVETRSNMEDLQKNPSELNAQEPHDEISQDATPQKE